MTLVLVYNVSSGVLNSILSNVHKIVRPDTYSCKLCSLTFGNFGEKHKWKAFRENSDVQMEFLHKDEFLRKYKSKWLPKFQFPLILYKTGENFEPFITTEELNDLKDESQLIELVTKKISN